MKSAGLKLQSVARSRDTQSDVIRETSASVTTTTTSILTTATDSQGPVTAALLVKVKDQPSWSAKEGKLVLGQTWILYRGEEKGKIILICEFWLIFISTGS